MTDTPVNANSEPTRPDDPDGIGEVVPDYSRMGFKQLRELAKTRGIPGDGTVTQLIDKHKAYDAQHGTAAPPDDEIDLLADDEPSQPETADPATLPTAGGGAASTSPAAGQTGAVLPETPAIVVVPAADAPRGLPAANIRSGTPNLEAKGGLVKVGEGHGAAEVRAFRAEFPVYGDVTDEQHFRYIAEAHAFAAQAGYTTKGGATVGERVGYSQDADGRRTVIYQVPVKRQR